MKILLAITVILLSTHLTSCENKISKKSASTVYTLNSDNSKTITLDTLRPVKEPETIAMGFLIWYRDNRSSLTALNFIPSIFKRRKNI
jgi:hypothetical protein